jgi:adenylate cyclase
MFVGNFGSDQLFNYTAMGDGMNLASRLEGANKPYGSLIMIGPRTYELAREHIEARELDAVRVAGKHEPVRVYELLALKGELPETKQRAIERYAVALAAFRQGRFSEAAKLLEDALAIEPSDAPSGALLARCREYEIEPPPGFDGITQLEK